MTTVTTNRDLQRITFVESLHNCLNKKTARVLSDYKKFISLASSYVEDGLEDSECVELLMIDGLSREAAESYVLMIKSNKENQEENDSLSEYNFQFEDGNGKRWSSYDIGRTVKANNEEEAMENAEESIKDLNVEGCRIISINKI